VSTALQTLTRGADGRDRVAALKPGQRRVRLAPDLLLLPPAAGAHGHEPDVARDVQPCQYVVRSVAAHVSCPKS
jgi:hypothetical protein